LIGIFEKGALFDTKRLHSLCFQIWEAEKAVLGRQKGQGYSRATCVPDRCGEAATEKKAFAPKSLAA